MPRRKQARLDYTNHSERYPSDLATTMSRVHSVREVSERLKISKTTLSTNLLRAGAGLSG